MAEVIVSYFRSLRASDFAGLLEVAPQVLTSAWLVPPGVLAFVSGVARSWAAPLGFRIRSLTSSEPGFLPFVHAWLLVPLVVLVAALFPLPLQCCCWQQGGETSTTQTKLRMSPSCVRPFAARDRCMHRMLRTSCVLCNLRDGATKCAWALGAGGGSLPGADER